MFAFTAVQAGPILATVLRESDMSQKEAAIITGHTNPAELSRALVSQRVLDVDKVGRLPWRVFALFIWRWVAAKLEDDARSLRAERLRMARADLRVSDERKIG